MTPCTFLPTCWPTVDACNFSYITCGKELSTSLEQTMEHHKGRQLFILKRVNTQLSSALFIVCVCMHIMHTCAQTCMCLHITCISACCWLLNDWIYFPCQFWSTCHVHPLFSFSNLAFRSLLSSCFCILIPFLVHVIRIYCNLYVIFIFASM